MYHGIGNQGVAQNVIDLIYFHLIVHAVNSVLLTSVILMHWAVCSAMFEDNPLC